jgi:poly(3-hydroxybutyrate) depolymerase
MPDVDHNFPCKSIEFWVTVPKACFTRSCGLILNIHGATMTNHATMEQATDMIAVGSKSDFIVVHPHQPGGTWDIPNDRVSIFATLQELITAFDVDRTHVHSTGYSQGGQISALLKHEWVSARLAARERAQESGAI